MWDLLFAFLSEQAAEVVIVIAMTGGTLAGLWFLTKYMASRQLPESEFRDDLLQRVGALATRCDHLEEQLHNERERRIEQERHITRLEALIEHFLVAIEQGSLEPEAARAIADRVLGRRPDTPGT